MFIRNSNLTGCPVFNLLNLTTLGRALKKKKDNMVYKCSDPECNKE